MHKIMGLAIAVILGGGSVAKAATWVVCPAKSDEAACQYKGDKAIQAAVDAAAGGDTILIRAGLYTPRTYRDIAYDGIIVRGYVVIDGKTLHLTGEDGAILDGAKGIPVAAFVFRGGDVTIDHLRLRNFRVLKAEDDIYDGHGLFAIDSHLTARNIKMDNFEKMAITAGGTSVVDISNVQIRDSHIGFWIREKAQARIDNTLVENAIGTGIAAYGTSSTKIYNSVFNGSIDDGIYADTNATIAVTNSIVMNNKPYGLRAAGSGRISINYSVVYDNETNWIAETEKADIQTGPGIVEGNPEIDGHYAPKPGSPLISGGNPAIHGADGSVRGIGLYAQP